MLTHLETQIRGGEGGRYFGLQRVSFFYQLARFAVLTCEGALQEVQVGKLSVGFRLGVLSFGFVWLWNWAGSLAWCFGLERGALWLRATLTWSLRLGTLGLSS